MQGLLQTQDLYANFNYSDIIQEWIALVQPTRPSYIHCRYHAILTHVRNDNA